AVVKEDGLGELVIFRRGVLPGRGAAEGDPAAAQMGDRKHYAIGEAIIGHGDVVAGDQQSRLDQVLGRYPRLAEVLLEREALGWGIAEAELDLRRRIESAVGEIAARLAAPPRRLRRLEES